MLFPTLEKDVVCVPWSTFIAILPSEESLSFEIAVPSTGLSIEESVSPMIKYFAGACEPVPASVQVRVIFSWTAETEKFVGWLVGSGSADASCWIIILSK